MFYAHLHSAAKNITICERTQTPETIDGGAASPHAQSHTHATRSRTRRRRRHTRMYAPPRRSVQKQVFCYHRISYQAEEAAHSRKQPHTHTQT